MTLPVVEDLREEGVEAEVRAHIALEEDECVHLILGRLARLRVADRRLRELRGCLKSLHQAVAHGLQRTHQIALLRAWVELHLHHAVHLEVIVVARAIELCAQVVDEVRVRHRFELGRLVVGLERRENLLGVVHEIDDVRRVFAGMRAVQARECLHRLDAREAPVDVHAREQGLVEARLEFVRDQKQLVLAPVGEGIADIASL